MLPIRRLFLSLCAILLAMNYMPPTVRAEAAVPKLEQIRVALFIDTGKFSQTTPFVTISADKSFDLALKSDGGLKPIDAGLTLAKAMADQFYVVLLETGDASGAQTLYKKLDEADKPAGIIIRQKTGQPLYQVYAGPYPTKETAASAKDSLSKQAAVAQSIGSFAPYVAGALHWNAGTYATEAEAVSQAAAIEQAGFAASVACLDNGGAVSYAVLVGNEADADALNALKSSLGKALPNVSLQPLGANAAYVIKRTEAAAGQAGSALSQFVLGGTAKLAATPREPGIKIAEKSGRAYRGSLELSVLTGKLAVVNELPFEDYVASVVGSELGAGWPAEALKAQAVAARTYALKSGNKYGIAHVSDSTADQVYKGMAAEAPAVVDAVNATKGEVLTDKDGLITPYFFSNAGGMTADPVEVWGKPISYLKSVPSPDEGAETTKPTQPTWYRVTLANGTSGYIHSDYVRATGQKNDAGLPIYEATGTNVNVRSGPGTENPSLAKVNTGDRFAVTDQSKESGGGGAYSWTRGPFTADELLAKINSALATPISKLERLEITARGPSGRVTEMKANGQVLKVPYPDSLRSLFGGLPSTRFEIEVSGSYTIGGTGGSAENGAASPPVYVLGAGQQVQKADAAKLYAINGNSEVKPLAPAKGPTQPQSQTQPQQGQSGPFTVTFKGTGNGHGLGMSQWGARGYAQLGYDYIKILQTYYVGVNIDKE
ncbi:SpoIID/LytB domain-containing protein [Paenibacillus hamazuiensis]|uniref:SpoIID/LytB domain-containing protein n=1 Tax=Paenibacillus hamazuiensis TaxID=2936508 RepID=UPI00200C3E1B|nr:SpoIID/LytB domain-containing protein [Paenibacillus hamazuiensis]